MPNLMDTKPPSPEDQMITVWFAHGKESGPNGRKIKTLARVADRLGYQTAAPDFRDLQDPDLRADRLVDLAHRSSGRDILVGSSMGGYACLIAASRLTPEGVFLLAPAIGLSNYSESSPPVPACTVEVIHGWQDAIVPAENVVHWAQQARCALHLVNDGHRLDNCLDLMEALFERFLKRLLSNPGAVDSPTPLTDPV